MKLSALLSTAILALALTSASAQAPATTTAGAHNPKPYRVTYTLTEMDGSKAVGVQHYSVIVVEGGRTTLKNGTKVPVATGSYSGGNAASVQTQFTYLDVGINIDTTLVDEIDGMWRIKSKVEQSSVADKPVVISGVSEPIVRQSVLEESSSVMIGKPQIIGTLDFTGTTRRLEIEVLLEPVK